jgi:hypothetical protein
VVDNAHGETGDKENPKPKDKDIENNPTAGNPHGQTGDKLTKDDLDQLLKDALTATLGPWQRELAGAVAGIRKDVGAVAERLNHVEAKVAKTEEAVAGTVTATVSGDRTAVQKGQRCTPALLDTAFMKIDAA